jgi:hypothetical protein
MMKPIDPTIAMPRKQIFTISETSSLEGFVVTRRSRFAESINSRGVKIRILLIC